MNYKRSVLIIISIFTLLLFSACEKNIFKPNDNFYTVTATQLPETNFTPTETVQAAFDYLKAADANGFNQYVYYPAIKKGETTYSYNIMFGNNLDGESKELIASIVADLTYEIGDVQEGEDSAVVTVKATNRDLSNIDLLAYADADNPLIEAIKNADNKTVTYNIKLTLTTIEGTWKIVVDEKFQRAISGGCFVPANERLNRILGDIF